MSIGVTTPTTTADMLALAQQRKEAAEKAKADAETAKATASEANTVASTNAETTANVASLAAGVAEKENADVKAAEDRLNSATLNVSTAQSSYNNACNQLTIANQSGDENAIASAQQAVDTAWQQLQDANTEKTNAENALNAEKAEAEAAQVAAEEAQVAADEAKAVAEEAQKALEQAEINLANAIAELEAAEIALADAEAANQAQGIQNEGQLSQAEIDKLVQEEGYVHITSKEQFLQIFQNCEIDLNGKYILGCDIDLSDIENWKPVGDDENPFTGVFNGNGFAISNLTIDATNISEAENIGFFGVTENAVITNVDFINASIKTSDDYLEGSAAVGIVAGTARGTSFENINVSGDVSGYQSVGGLVGVINDNSYLNANGELVEVNNSYLANITTNVDANGKYFVGGLVGSVADTSTAEGVATRDLTIVNCNTSGNIVFDEESAGGMIGEAGKTIITILDSQSNVNIQWNNADDDGDISFLMETGRAGGFIGCANGTYIAICNSEYSGNLDVEGDFKGEYYGWYMNDAHITMYEIPAGLPADDILKIDGVDGLTPVTDTETGEAHYQITVSTLTGLDKVVTMIQANPALADLVVFNVTFDFELMDGMYDSSVYAQYGVTQHLYQDEEGTIHNDVYIDNEIELETTFRGEPSYYETNVEIDYENCLGTTMVSGLYTRETEDGEKEYVVNTEEGLKTVNLVFNHSNQVTSVTTRLDSDEVRYRECITQMVKYYQQKMYDALKALFGFDQDYEVPEINKAEYKKLQKMVEAGKELTPEQKLAMAAFEVDYNVMNRVAEVTHNQGCGMGGNASFLDETKTIHMQDEQGRPLFTTLNGDALRQRMDENGTLMVDEEGNPVYENLDGSDYTGFAEVFAQRAYPKTDDDGNFLYTDNDGNTITKSVGEDGEDIYTNADGTPFEGNVEDLEQQIEPCNISEEYAGLTEDMTNIISDIEAGKYPQGTTEEATPVVDEVPSGDNTSTETDANGNGINDEDEKEEIV